MGSSTGGGLETRERAMGWGGLGCSGGWDSRVRERGDLWWTWVGLQMRKRMNVDDDDKRVQGGGRRAGL